MTGNSLPEPSEEPEVKKRSGELLPLALANSQSDEIAFSETPPPRMASSAKVELPHSSSRYLHELVEFIQNACLSSIKFVWWGIRASFGYLRYHPVHAVINLAFICFLSLLVITGSEIHDQIILGEISNDTVESIVKASQHTRHYKSQRVSANGVQEFLRVGAPEWAQKESVKAILFHARRVGLSIEDQAVLLATVEVESGFNPMARAPTTTACGLFQFVRGTAVLYKLSQADCMDPWLNAAAGIQHYIENYNNLVQDKVLDLTGPEKVFRTYELTYYLHHDGPASSNPASDVKAVILSGTQFLFHSYDLLKKEAQSKKHAPTFGQRFTENFWKFMGRIRRYFGEHF